MSLAHSASGIAIDNIEGVWESLRLRHDQDFRMRAIKQIRRFIEADPHDAAARTLADLVLALEDESPFSVAALYALDLEHFELAMQMLDEWRLDRFYMGKAKLFDVSWQHRELRSEGASPN